MNSMANTNLVAVPKAPPAALAASGAVDIAVDIVVVLADEGGVV